MAREFVVAVGRGESSGLVWAGARGPVRDVSPCARNPCAAPATTPTAPAAITDGERVTLGAIGRNFVQVTLFYTPANAAILATLAALVGGSASNLVIDRQQLDELEPKGHTG